MPPDDAFPHRPPDERARQNIRDEMGAVVHARHGDAAGDRVADRRDDPIVVVTGDGGRHGESARRMSRRETLMFGERTK